jgi:hypothetical protein
MKKHEVLIGGTYLAKVSDKLVSVRIDAENPYGGWDATNLLTGKKVRIKTAQRLRCPANRTGTPQTQPAAPGDAEANARNKKTTEAKPAAEAEPATETKPQKLSALDAAAQVLRETGQAMRCQEMIDLMAAKGYWTSPGGKTPAATLYSAILREITTKAKESRFVKSERGEFALAK